MYIYIYIYIYLFDIHMYADISMLDYNDLLAFLLISSFNGILFVVWLVGSFCISSLV